MNSRGVPDDGIFSPKVAMGENVSKAGNCSPRNLRELRRDFIREIFDSLANDFKIADYGVNRTSVANE
jgi:hypothetical protein